MYSNMKLAVKALGILAGSAVLGVLLLALAFFIPVNPENMQASYDIIEKEGWYPAMPIVSSSLDTYFHSLMPGVLDDSTDRVMLTTALEASDSSPFRAAMDMRGYSYYWHGYVSILRPLLYLFDYGEIRVLNCIGQLLFLFFLTHFLWKKKGLRYGLMLFSSYIFLMPMAMPLSLQFSWVFYLAYGGTAFLLVRWEKLQKGPGIYLTFLVLGILTSFLDLLTYPLYTWAIPLIWLLAMEQEGKSIWRHLRQVIGTGCLWIMGYAGMWASKWLLGSVILKTNIFESAIAEVFLRAGMEEGAKSGLAGRLEAMYINWKHYEYEIYGLLLACWLVWVIFKTLRGSWQHSKKSPALLLIAFSSVVWYFVLSNHTMGHHFFTYRIWGISICAMLVLYGENICCTPTRKTAKQLLCSLAAWGFLAVCSFGLSFLAREDISAMNGMAVFREAELSSNSVMEVSYTPSFPVVTKLGAGIKSASTQGEYILSLYDNENLLYSARVPLASLEGRNYYEVPVSWHLEAGKAYTLKGTLEGNDQPAFLLITENLEMPLSEYGEASIDGIPAYGQPLAGNTYSYRPLSRSTLLFLTISWMGVLAAPLFEIYTAITLGRNKKDAQGL